MEKETKEKKKVRDKKKYIKPEITKVWSENIGLKGAYLLEM
jgi:hypothetical protein